MHRYKGVEVIEEAGGTTRIKKQHEGGGTYTTPEGVDESFEGISHEIDMAITKGEYVKNKQGKIIKEVDSRHQKNMMPTVLPCIINTHHDYQGMYP